MMAMITVLLIRHGIAEEPRPGLRDPDRGLTLDGWEKTRAAMRGLVARGYLPTRGVSSPYRRAAETLACLKEATAEGFPVACWEGLEPGGDMAEAETWLRAVVAEAGPFETIALVSHNPFAADFLRHLTGQSREMKKAGCAVLHCSAGRFELGAHFTPSQLRGGE
jgi:phosphohistidine phosphatase